MVADLIRDAPAGQLLNWLSAGRICSYPEQRPSYTVPPRFLLPASGSDTGSTVCNSRPSSTPPCSSPHLLAHVSSTTSHHNNILCLSLEAAIKPKSDKTKEQKEQTAEYLWLVDWNENDADNPKNWTMRKQCFVGAVVSVLAFTSYAGGTIHVAAVEGLMEEFHISHTTAMSGLTLFVAGYGIGPMVLAPLQELHFLGRNPVYVITALLFFLTQFATVWAPNISLLLAFRFFSGVFASPSIATGAATMTDVFQARFAAAAVGIWAACSVSGPVTMIVPAGFAVQALGWRWAYVELLILSGIACLAVVVGFPETLESTILLRRAQRLRHLTGNQLLKTRYELAEDLLRTADASRTHAVLHEIRINVTRAFRLLAEPVLLISNLYIALVYCIFYLWFEAFPLVFNKTYGFNHAVGTLPYLTFTVSVLICMAIHTFYQLYHINPRLHRNPDLPPEVRLELGVIASLFVPLSLLVFGWSARTGVHWIVPVIGAALYVPGLYLSFQSIMVYMACSYPIYAASVLAGNDLFRSVSASVFPLFGTRYYEVLGVGGGCSLLAGVSLLMTPVFYFIMRKGAILRAKSRFT